VVQPVILLATGIGEALGVPVINCITTTRSATQLKDITDPDQRREALEGLYDVDPAHTAGAHILLFDDLFRSGATMNAITDVLLGKGKAASVRVFTITRTRSNR
jgi:predicted amidophosphoribosyltransferase